MADVRVVAPDGTKGSVPEEDLESALAQGFRLESGTDVRVVAPDGTAGTVPQDDVSAALSEGYRLESAKREEDRYSSPLQTAATFGEGVAKGASLGMQTPLAALEGFGSYLGSKAFEATQPEAPKATLSQSIDEAQTDISRRAEANPIANVAGQLTGVVGSTLATGGAGAATGTGLLARGSTALAERAAAGVSATAARGLLRPATRLLVQGATEGAVFSAAQEVDRSFQSGDWEGIAERAAAAAWDGAKLGGPLGVAAGAGLGVAGAAVRGAARVPGKLRELAGTSAYKAIVGRTNKASMKAAERHGGAAAVGRELLEDGSIPLAGGFEAKVEALTRNVDDLGKQLGDIVTEIDDAAQGVSMAVRPSRIALRDRIQSEVLEPLRQGTFSADTYRAVKRKLDGLLGQLSRAERPVVVRGKGGSAALNRDKISYEDLKALRVELDQELGNWNKLTAEQGPLKAFRDTRRVIEDYWIESVEQMGVAAGKPDLAQRVRDLKRAYAAQALARDQAQEALETALANRSISPSDYMTGAGVGIGTGNPLTAVASAVGHKLARERGRGVAALALDRAADGATALQAALSRAAETRALSSVARGAKAAKGSLRRALTLEAAEGEISMLSASHPVYMGLQQQTEELRESGFPELADAVDAHQARVREYLAAKAPPMGDPDVFGSQAPRDRAALAKFARYADAARNPEGALMRVAYGMHHGEDLEVLRELYPSLLTDLRAKVAERLPGSAAKHSLRDRAALEELGVPTGPSSSPEHAAWLQGLAASTQEPEPEQQAPRRPKPRGQYDAHGDRYAVRGDRAE
jgi:hypothetical protein